MNIRLVFVHNFCKLKIRRIEAPSDMNKTLDGSTYPGWKIFRFSSLDVNSCKWKCSWLYPGPVLPPTRWWSLIEREETKILRPTCWNLLFIEELKMFLVQADLWVFLYLISTSVPKTTGVLRPQFQLRLFECHSTLLVMHIHKRGNLSNLSLIRFDAI